MATASGKGLHLWYETKGEGPPLALIGGFALLDSQWEFVLDDLAAKHKVVNWCVRGSGKSDWTMTSPPNVDQYADDLRIVLDAAGIEKTAVWATSTGAPIGVRFAAKYPERTSALITYPWFKTDDTWRGIMDCGTLVSKYFGIGAMSRLFAGSVMPPALLYSPEGSKFELWARKRYEANLNPNTLHHVTNAYREVDLTGDVKRITCPTLLLMGNESLQNNLDFMKEVSYDYLTRSFLELKPDCELATIKEAGSTYCMITHPRVCSGVVLDYLARTLGR